MSVNINTVADINALKLYTGPETALVVQDLKRGGLFNFEQYGGSVTCTITSSGGIAVITTLLDHGLSAGDRVVFSGLTSWTTIIPTVVYYVISKNLSPTAFSIALGYENTPMTYGTFAGTPTFQQVYYCTRVLPQVSAISTSGTATITTAAAHGWSVETW